LNICLLIKLISLGNRFYYFFGTKSIKHVYFYIQQNKLFILGYIYLGLKIVRIRVEFIVGLIKVLFVPRFFAADAAVSRVTGPTLRFDKGTIPGRTIGAGEPITVKSKSLVFIVGGVGILFVVGDDIFGDAVDVVVRDWETDRLFDDDEAVISSIFLADPTAGELFRIRGDMGNKYVVASCTVARGDAQKLSKIPDNGLAIYVGAGTV